MVEIPPFRLTPNTALFVLSIHFIRLFAGTVVSHFPAILPGAGLMQQRAGLGLLPLLVSL